MKETILVIDDNESLRESVASYLEDREFRVLTAENGRVGLDILEREKPDLVLTDLRMPEIDGVGVLKRAKEIAPEMPTIVVSGTGRIADTVHALKFGAWDYILKPVEDMSVIAHAVDMALEHARLLKDKRDYQATLEATVRERTAELEKANDSLMRSQQELRASERRLTEINGCLLQLGTNYGENCNRVTELCGSLLRSTSAFYSRLEGGAFLTIGRWHAPEGYEAQRKAEGTVCFDTVRCNRGDAILRKNLGSSEFARENSYVERFGWKTYLGHPVQCNGATVGCLCAVYAEDVDPSPDDMRVIGILAAAIGLEEERKRVEKTLQDVMDHNPMSIQIVDEGGLTLQANAAYARMFGKQPDPEFSVFRDSALARQGHGDLFERVRAGEVVHFPEFQYNAHDRNPELPDQPIWIRTVGFPLLDGSGRPERFVLMHEDVTERKHAEEEGERLQAQLAQAQKMESVGRLAGGVAHDFNNMLGVILGYTELALDGTPPDQPLYAGLLEIRKATERSANLTRQLLAFARKQTIAPRMMDMNETVEGMLKMLRRVIGEQVELEWRPGKSLGPVKMDPTQVDQILVNLCVNARDAIGERGGIVIETGSAVLDAAACAGREDVMPGDFVKLTVSDNGCGMTAETMAHIFEPFFTTKGVGEGTGLGLATVHGIARQNKGLIEVRSELGKGTTFDVYLPRHAEQAEPAVEKPEEKPMVPGSATILLVEDEPAILNMVRSLLERQKYNVLSTSSPIEAIRIAGDHPGQIDLLMTDMVMPEMSGRDLASNLPSLQPGMRCLFMSGHSDEMLTRHGILDAGVHFIQKPFTMKGLAAKVVEVLREKPAAAAGRKPA